MDINEALLYAPIIYMDKREPFGIKKVGFAEYDIDGESSVSFNRFFDFGNFEGAVKVLEYAYYLDYDIQHLYDLEHIWVYVDNRGNIVGAEGSFHGRFLNAMAPDFSHMFKKDAIEEEIFVPDKDGAKVIYPKGSRIIMYSQPGKHAMLSDPKLMYLYTELFESCQRLAGIHGLDAPEKYLKDIHLTDDENMRIAMHIRENFGFDPSMEFEEAEILEKDYMPWNELEGKIPEYIKAQLDVIL